MNQQGEYPYRSSEPNAGWGPMRVVYLQYASDPVTFYDYRSLYREPDWMRSAARPGRVAGITVVSGCDSSSIDPGHAHGDHIAGRLRPCLRPGALHRRMDRGDGCSQLVARRSRATEAIPLQEAVRRDRCSDHPSWSPCDSASSVMLSGAAAARRACCCWTSHQDGSGRARALDRKSDDVAHRGERSCTARPSTRGRRFCCSSPCRGCGTTGSGSTRRIAIAATA